MSRFSRIKTIWRKELLDTLRDRRTLIAMVVVPILLYPALMLGSMQAIELQQSRVEKSVSTIAVPDEATEAWFNRLISTDIGRQRKAAGVPSEELPELEEELQSVPSGELLSDDFKAKTNEEYRDEIAKNRPGRYRVVVVDGLADEVDRAIVSDLRAANVPEEAIPTLLSQFWRGQSLSLEGRDDADPAVVEKVAAIDVMKYRGMIAAALEKNIRSHEVQAAVMIYGEGPWVGANGTSPVELIYDATNFRSAFAKTSLSGVLERLEAEIKADRYKAKGLDESFDNPLELNAISVATTEQRSGYALGMILPLILITMTITGAIYPAIDLTAGERERGTLETLMATPVPRVDLIAGKFFVVTLIGMVSAILNLLSMGLTMHFGGIGKALTSGGGAFEFPLHAIPLTLLVMIPLTIMFSAALLAVCSFARTFKEAQNYVMPVMVAAMIPAIIGVLPGSRLDGPMLAFPVANIVLLMRDLFVGEFNFVNIAWVTITTCLYAGAAVAISAKLFGQEAVLFADSGSVKALFVRKFFKQKSVVSTSQAFLVLAIVYIVNFFVQSSLIQVPAFEEGIRYFAVIALLLVTLMGIVPFVTAIYLRVWPMTGFALKMPRPMAFVAALCFGVSTWILAIAWMAFQQKYITMLPEMKTAMSQITSRLEHVPIWQVVFFLAIVPGIVEELFFRGFLLNGFKRGIGPISAVLITAFAFAMFHGSVHRFVITGVLGALFGLIVIRTGSIWPAMLAHIMHNSLSMVLPGWSTWSDAMNKWNLTIDPDAGVSPMILFVAIGLTIIGIAICLSMKQKTQLVPLRGFPVAQLEKEPVSETV